MMESRLVRFVEAYKRQERGRYGTLYRPLPF